MFRHYQIAVPEWLFGWLQKIGNRSIVIIPEVRLDWLVGVPTLFGPVTISVTFDENSDARG